MMDEVIGVLEGLPRQTAVFVVFAVEEEVIHVISMDVNAKYSVVRAMRPELLNQIAENGRRDGGVAVGDDLFATPRQHMLLQYVEDLMRSEHYSSSDKAGYYNGVPGGTIMSTFSPQSVSVARLEMVDMMVPYTRYHLSEDRLRTEMGTIPVSRDGVIGPVELMGGGATNRISVSMNMGHIIPSPYIIAKIDLLCSLGEHQFYDDYIFCEKMLSSEMNGEELEQVRNSAVNIMRILVDHPTGYEPIDPHSKDVISQSLSRQWTIQMHDHIVID